MIVRLRIDALSVVMVRALRLGYCSDLELRTRSGCRKDLEMNGGLRYATTCLSWNGIGTVDRVNVVAPWGGERGAGI